MTTRDGRTPAPRWPVSLGPVPPGYRRYKVITTQMEPGCSQIIDVPTTSDPLPALERAAGPGTVIAYATDITEPGERIMLVPDRRGKG